MKAESVLATIGNTPHIRINRIFQLKDSCLDLKT